ncbi:MAG: ATP-binding protein [Desulfurococcaceae archaeon]
MNCKLCGTSGYYRPSYLKYWLCETHFVEYFEKRVLRFFSKPGRDLRNKKILVALSGGKDSVSLLHILLKNRDVLKYTNIVAVHVNLGISGFSDLVENVVRDIAGGENVPFLLIDLKNLIGIGLPELSRKARRAPCSVCGLVKRYLFNAVAETGGFDIVMTGHHLDDALKFMLKDMITYDVHSLRGLKPVVISVNGVTRMKPLTTVYEDDIKAYVKATGLKHIETPCPFKHIGDVDRAVDSITRVLEDNIPGGKIMLYRNLCKLVEEYLKSDENGILRCQYCYSPSRNHICGFCKLTENVLGEPRGIFVKKNIAKLLDNMEMKWVV